MLALKGMTDQGLFERLASAVLREAEPRYSTLAHTGLNSSGKTITDPLDGICILPGPESPHLVAFHHTTAARSKLRSKWLSGDRRNLGDVTKTVERIIDERRRRPDLRATLVLTSTEGPASKLVSDVHAVGLESDLEIDLWDPSRLAHFLDNNPRGQWLRKKYLGIAQELLSAELFRDLAKKSLAAHRPPDDPATWVPRELDDRIASELRSGVTFLVAASGLGKTVACHRALAAHIEAGGLGIVLPPELVAANVDLDRALGEALGQLHAALDALSPSPLSFGTVSTPVLVIVEDVNRATDTRHLVERLASWSWARSGDEEAGRNHWRLICPLWPEQLATLADPLRRAIESRIVVADRFSDQEAREAVVTRALVAGVQLSQLEATGIARSLGNDPLLIGLHEGAGDADPDRTIGDYVGSCLTRVEHRDGSCSATELRMALRVLAGEMLVRRRLNVRWDDAVCWPALRGDASERITRVAHAGELVRFEGPAEAQTLAFRHDRVRQWVLADAVVHLEREDALADDVLSDPFFADVVGAALDRARAVPHFLARVKSASPLALFEALRLSAIAGTHHHSAVAEAIASWIEDPVSRGRSTASLRMEAMAKLSETDSPLVPGLARKIPDATITRSLALLRNGDVVGGVNLCCNLEPGVGAPWRDVQVAHALARHGPGLTARLDAFLRGAALNDLGRLGALRLAGHFQDPTLAGAVAACWDSDPNRSARLGDYLWAFAQTCGDEAEVYLAPVLDMWAALPDKPDRPGFPSPRDDLAAESVRWAFHRWPPVCAIGYLIDRAVRDDCLRWPITYLLHGLDHPEALRFTVREFAGESPFGRGDTWRHAQDQGRPMSARSREVLLKMFVDDGEDEETRLTAFDFWAATRGLHDMKDLAGVKLDGTIGDRVLRARLERGDRAAVPALIEKLETQEGEYWWWHARHCPTKELTAVIRSALDERGKRVARHWNESYFLDAVLCEVFVRMAVSEAEEILLDHWRHLRYAARFVHAALFIATPRLQDVAGIAIAECPEPATLMSHIGIHFGILRSDHPGLSHEEQIRALAPHCDFISASDLRRFWHECHARGWYALRRELLDARVDEAWTPSRASDELDEILNEGRWVDIWVKSKRKADVRWEEIVSTLIGWLDRHPTEDALELVAGVIAQEGTRADLARLRTLAEGHSESARQVLADTSFAVRRRSVT